MEFHGGEKLSASMYAQFAEEAVSFFTTRDLIFERGDQGISVILPDVNMEESMIMAEEFRSRVSVSLAESFHNENLTDASSADASATDARDLFIGISSRSGRLLEADRLVLEASTALEKTREEPVSPIVAFKSDPEKYRKFVKENVSGEW
jgi:GGDEF domain-containing protein